MGEDCSWEARAHLKTSFFAGFIVARLFRFVSGLVVQNVVVEVEPYAKVKGARQERIVQKVFNLVNWEKRSKIQRDQSW